MGLEGDEFRGGVGRYGGHDGGRVASGGERERDSRRARLWGALLYYPTALPTCKCCGGVEFDHIVLR